MGLEKTLTLHDGRHWTLPDRTEMEEELAELQRAQAKCNRRCYRYRMLGKKIRKLHKKAVNRDKQWMWDLANQLAEELDVLVLEDLKLKNLVSSARGSATMPGRGVAQKRGLNRRLHRAGLGRLKTILARAFAKRGKATKVVNPWGTSTTCHVCKHSARASRETQSDFRCVACGHEANADVNAARNVRDRGWRAEHDRPPPWSQGSGDRPLRTRVGREPGTSATGQPRVGKEVAGQPAQVWPEGLPRAESNTAEDAADATFQGI